MRLPWIEDLKHFLSETELNKTNYKRLLRKFDSEKELLKSFTAFLDERINSSMNMAIFINSNQSVTFVLNGAVLTHQMAQLLTHRMALKLTHP